MFTKPLRVVMGVLLAVILLAGLDGTAHAYLKGSPGAPVPLGPGDTPDYLTTPNWANSPPMRKFIDTLPELNTPNNLGQSLPIAVKDTTTYPDADYYIIKLVEFDMQMHSDLPTSRLRGYVQMQGDGVTPPSDPGYLASLTPMGTPQFLGPVIVAQKDRPVRVLFINGLPTGTGGELFVPVDQTIMGSGDYQIDYDPITKAPAPLISGKFSQNRGELHLHGGRTPWISDGTPHQWITPFGENPDYHQGVSVVNVPDMPDPGPGAQTYYWTNQQSARLMFYHDHAWGITRLNVYIGEAAGYLIQDPVENALVNEGILPVDEIPLVIQDRTFVDETTISATDPTWRWGTGTVTGQISEFGSMVDVHAPKTGDLWWPHVYMPAQNPFDITGIAPMGRWAYGPYFWPATNNPYQPIPNPYFNSLCDAYNDANGDGTFDQTDIDWNKANILGYTTIPIPGALPTDLIQETPYCQAPEIPSTPNPSWGAEAFMDTPMVNGTAYPVVEVDPKAYRLRILNAAHDRFFNLQFYKVDNLDLANQAPGTHCDGVDATVPCDVYTEVKMLPAVDYSVDPTWPATWPVDGRPGGIPDWTMRGPNWLQIGTEGGFLVQPVDIPAHPVTWNVDVTTFNAGNVNGGSLILGPAERADVVVDFEAFAGQELILYNDAPAPWPAIDPHYDYFTGAPDMTEAGGAPPTLPGMGPNTRTIMKIVVRGTPLTDETATGAAYDPANVYAAFAGAMPSGTFSGGSGNSVFRLGQDPLIVGQGNLNPTADPAHYEAFLFNQDYSGISDVFGSFPTSYPNWGIARINDKAINFVGATGDMTYAYNPADTTPAPWDPTKTLNGALPMKFKAIQDEQGETFDDYGRMRAGLGLELVNPAANQVNFIIQTYSDPSTEILEENGIQVWKITHNGVDTHPVHFHLYDVQILNRVGWDGFIRIPDPNEVGWKDTIRISPLEDTIIALKPVTPMTPFGVPESVRPLNPARPLGDQTELTQIDPYTGNARVNLNRMYNLDWEYVWHCHILSHEENDMMRNQSFLFQEATPSYALLFLTDSGTSVDLSWTDPTPAADPATLGNPQNEIYFQIERATSKNGFNQGKYDVFKVLANQTSFSDTTFTPGGYYEYRLASVNATGLSPYSNIAVLGDTLPAAPTGLNATIQSGPQILLTWTDNANNETAFVVNRCTGIACTDFAQIAMIGPRNNTGGVSYTDTAVAGGNTYVYQVAAVNGAGLSYSNQTPVAIPFPPVAPTTLTASAVRQGGNERVTLNWSPDVANETGYTIQRATNSTFTAGLNTTNVPANTTTYTTGNISRTNWYFRIRAYNPGGTSAWLNATPFPVPPAP